MSDELSQTLDIFLRIWNFQLFSIDGSAITLGKIVIGFVLIIVGYFVARRMSRQIGSRVIRRLKLQSSLEYTLERLTFYLLYVFLLLFILQMLSIPITIFTVLGSALAIGIGFGSQNLVNNFISGIIVMVEQPVRVGDWIEIEGVFGQVEQIGGRSTYIRSLDNKQAVIPNSIFLEKVFVNWTLHEDTIIAKVAVGVAYGSNVQLVKELLLQAASEHPDVLKDPAPAVLFSDFADSSLNFELSFSLPFSVQLTGTRVASDLRFRIDELFRQKNISIPFPHRELLFDPSRTLSVRVQKDH